MSGHLHSTVALILPDKFSSVITPRVIVNNIRGDFWGDFSKLEVKTLDETESGGLNLKKAIALFLALSIFALCTLSGCADSKIVLDSKNPVTLTMWHNFGGQMQQTIDELVDEFNSTIGEEQGIILSVTSISSSKDLQEKLDMIAAGDPGAPKMPNISTLYPKTALSLQEKGLLVNLDTQFTSDELLEYVPGFINEGRLEDGGLYVFPFSKSTEVLYVNQTLFDRFSSATNVSLDSLSTFEGIAHATIEYYKWTDAQTPDVPNDGKTFYTADSWFNIAQSGMKQLGNTLIKNEKLNLSADEYKTIWDFCYLPAIQGGYGIFDGYSSDLSKTGEIVCSTGSTAGILFYGDSITYPDNTTEQVEYTVLPFPIFEGAKKVAIQRGSGMCVADSTPEKEYASALFLKWFTAPTQNVRFISSTGYLPVTNEAFESILAQDIQQVENTNVKKLLAAATKMYREYDFYVAPVFDAFDPLSTSYEKDIKQSMNDGREAFFQLDEKNHEMITQINTQGITNFIKEE